MLHLSPHGVGGAVAPFPALWTADETVLGKFFPDTEGNQNRAYDASKADAALARHLAFWTGRDCERIRRLMERSALVRSKWLREDYIYRTVLGVCAITRDVYAKGAVVALDGVSLEIPTGQILGIVGQNGNIGAFGHGEVPDVSGAHPAPGRKGPQPPLDDARAPP